ncbi:prepilin-type N-terminal cleavage/methylation domain-containing protein [Jeotgalicoccus saudimassiliensis]|uniref:prepilin-type N-terminal cleavage/methylation domain-containing protein n=1 Tax=Jeotgalicoccus saudimassiliensis TaxID=1461582 RepID=UPI0006919EEA|nr:prepilin-type N-terminal cleavage/methylation domain-containing protein [Jeotgalicoccus saudimassiliensis]
MAKQQESNGFTMMEMMLTLLLVSIILSLSVPHLPVYRQNDTGDEIETVSYVFQGAQMHAMATGRSYTVLMDYDKQSIDVVDPDRKIISQYKLKACTLAEEGMSRFSYRPNGDTSGFGTVYLSCSGRTVKFIFQIVKGRFRIEQ